MIGQYKYRKVGMMCINERIQAELDRLEREKDIKILLAIESVSRIAAFRETLGLEL